MTFRNDPPADAGPPPARVNPIPTPSDATAYAVSAAALAQADEICQRHGMLRRGYMANTLAEYLDAFALERGRDAVSATITEFVDAVQARSPLPKNQWNQTWPPGPILDQLIREGVRARELQLAQIARDTGINELIRFAETIEGARP